jgi:hypothetical protein
MDASGNTPKVKLTKEEVMERRRVREEAAGFTGEKKAEFLAKLKAWNASLHIAKKRS